jgi:hypothetical protein
MADIESMMRFISATSSPRTPTNVLAATVAKLEE